jgi:hypothetical protein
MALFQWSTFSVDDGSKEIPLEPQKSDFATPAQCIATYTDQAIQDVPRGSDI